MTTSITSEDLMEAKTSFPQRILILLDEHFAQMTLEDIQINSEAQWLHILIGLTQDEIGPKNPDYFPLTRALLKLRDIYEMETILSWEGQSPWLTERMEKLEQEIISSLPALPEKAPSEDDLIYDEEIYQKMKKELTKLFHDTSEALTPDDMDEWPDNEGFLQTMAGILHKEREKFSLVTIYQANAEEDDIVETAIKIALPIGNYGGLAQLMGIGMGIYLTLTGMEGLIEHKVAGEDEKIIITHTITHKTS